MMTMGYTTERLNNRVFLVARQGDEVPEAYQLAMLSHNSIASLLEFSLRYVNNDRYYYYDITGLQSLNSLNSDVQVSAEAVTILCAALAELQVSMNEYLLDLQRVLLTPDYVYTNAGFDRFLFLYDPDKPAEDSTQEGLRKLFEFILRHFDHTEDRADTVMVYDIYSRILKGSFEPSDYVRTREKNKNTAAKGENIPARTWELPEETEKTEEKETSAAPGEISFAEKDDIPRRKREKRFAAAVFFPGLIAVVSAGLLIYPGHLPFERNSMLLLGICAASAVAALIVSRIGKRRAEKPENDKYKKSRSGTPEKCETETHQAEVADDNPVKAEINAATAGKSAAPEMSGGEEDTIRLYAADSEENDRRELFDDATSPLPMIEDESPEMYLEDGTGRVYEVESLPFVIGTNAVCDARLSDRTVSRRHMKLFRIGDRTAVTDLGSTNGTWLNGHRLGPGESRLLGDGDVLGLGSGHLTVHILG